MSVPLLEDKGWLKDPQNTLLDWIPASQVPRRHTTPSRGRVYVHLSTCPHTLTLTKNYHYLTTVLYPAPTMKHDPAPCALTLHPSV